MTRLRSRVEAGAAVHLAFDHRDLVDGALDLAGVPGQGEAVGDWSVRMPAAKERRPAWSSASTAASQASRSRLPVRAVIISAKAVTAGSPSSARPAVLLSLSGDGSLPRARQLGLLEG
jgi:hypothetical protein